VPTLHQTLQLDLQPNGCYTKTVDTDMDKVFKALADPSRRLLLDRLRASNGLTLSELCRDLDMSRQGVAKHLKRLAEANLVVTRRPGRQNMHYLNPVPIQQIADRWIGNYEQGRLRLLTQLKQDLEKEADE
jgi:DNA-binding transcriptional ArsR family regulator